MPHVVRGATFILLPSRPPLWCLARPATGLVLLVVLVAAVVALGQRVMPSLLESRRSSW